MQDERLVDRWIDDALAGSGLSVERREDVAEELHAHLDQLTAAKCEAGLSGAEAVRAALADFGEARVIREHLRRQQTAADHEAVCREVRTHLVGLLSLPAAISLIVFFANCARGGTSLSLIVAACVTLFVFSALAMCLVAFGWGLVKRQAGRRLPPYEYHPGATFARWFLLGNVVLQLSALALSLGMLGALGCVMATVDAGGLGFAFGSVLESVRSMNRDHQLALILMVFISALAAGFSLAATAYGRLHCSKVGPASA